MEEEQINHPDKNNSTPEWLDRLQNESWQAEILISGGAFFVLLSSFGSIDLFFNYLRYSTTINYALLALDNVFTWSITFLLAGFLLHLVLRGYWIGLIGLNYVFPSGINTSKLAFKGKFKNLFNESGNTPMLIRIDKLCSVIFSISFLFLTSMIGFSLYFTLLLVLAGTIGAKFFVFPILIFIISIVGLITFVDFITLGRLKRLGWFAKIYYPVYIFASAITLSFLYRRLYYTLVSNVGAKYIVLLFAIQFTLILFPDVFSNSSALSGTLANKRGGYHYLQDREFLSIKSEVTEEPSLDFSLLHMVRFEEAAFLKWKRIHTNETKVTALEMMDPGDQLTLITSTYDVYVDDKLVTGIQWLYKEDKTAGLSFNHLIAFLDIRELPEGNHSIAVKINLDKSDLPVFLLMSGYFARLNFMVKHPGVQAGK